MLVLHFDDAVVERIRLQNRQTMRDLPSRFVSISLTSALATCYLPVSLMLVFFVTYLANEGVGLLAIRRLGRRVDLAGVIGLLAVALVGSGALAALLAYLWGQDGVAPKVVSFAGLSTALLHCTMVRSTWMPFGIATALPLAVGMLTSVLVYLFATATTLDAMTGSALLLVMVGYVTRSMLDMHGTRRELLEASARANDASRAKSRFLAAMSHEIRTPLNAIHGMSQLLRDDFEPALLEERTTLLLKASASLRAIVDDVLDHAKIEAGRFQLRPVPANPAEEIRGAVELFRGSAAAKGLGLGIVLDGPLPERASFDALRVRQVVGNLVSNAVKYSDAGRIEVTLRSEPAGAGWDLAVAVADQGPGLTEAEMGALFQDFARIERDDRPTTAGTGLGLAIARGFAQLMGGDVTVASAPGAGATFTFCFRAEPVALRDDALPAPDRGAGAEARLAGAGPILLVDDTASNRYVVRALLRRTGVEIVEATNGVEALHELARRSFALVLLDMHMPVLDGMSTFAEMHKAGGRTATTPVIALTADAAPDDRDRYLERGLAGYVCKPVQRAELVAEIARMLPEPKAAAA